MESLKEVYDSVVNYCMNTGVTEQAYRVFFKSMTLEYLDSEKATFFAENPFKANMVKEKFLTLIKTALEETLGFPVEVQISANNYNHSMFDDSVKKEIDDFREAAQRVSDSYTKAQYEYTFETFIEGDSNNFALAACKSVTEKGSINNNPLFIHGNSGLGKTHLMYAIANRIISNIPNSKIIYTSSESYGNDFYSALGHSKMEEFRAKYRSVNILLFDDVQFFAGKDKLQEELFHTFNHLYERGRQIVLTSDKPAKNIELLEDRIKTRFEWGLIAEILPPDESTRIAIVKRKAELLELNISDDIIITIASMIQNNIRQLESAVKKLKALQYFSNATLNVALAQGVARDVLSDADAKTVSVDKILQVVSNVYNVTVQDIRSKSRNQNISLARKVCAYIIKEILNMSLQEIGSELGKRDHSTIIYAINDIQSQFDNDQNFKNFINEMIKNINTGKV